MSEKILASNYFSDRQKQNRKLRRRRPRSPKQRIPAAGGSLTDKLRRLLADLKNRRAIKKDLKIRKQADYLSSLPETRFRRLLHKLRPKKVLGFIFSIRGLVLGIKIAVVIGILGTTAVAVLYLHYRRDVPTSIANLQSCVEGQTTKYYDRTGEVLLWASKSDFDCQPVQLEDVSHHLINALITVEDKDFYSHSGFEIQAIVRAGINNLLNRKTQGGSTITQQYIKNAILQDRSRTFDRKIREIILAVELERTFEKDEILTAYLNTVAFGSIYSGIEAAAQGYFDKSSKNLTLDEAALLVAALPAPSVYWGDPELHTNRQRWVLRQMLDSGHISKAEYEKSSGIDTLAKIRASHEQYEGIKAPHFVLEAERRLTAELCVAERLEDPEAKCDNIRLRGYKVITTLDMRAQELAERSVDTVIPTIADRGFDNAASVAVEVESGKVLALVGSRDFGYEGFGQTNTITQQRDPGSTFKIFDYGALFETTSDWGPGSIIYDYSTVFDNRDWQPENYDGRHAGPITVRKALGRSLNIPAIKAMYIAGQDAVHDFAREAGIRTKLPCTGGCGLASAIGAGSEVRLDELTNAYATFSRGGVYLPLTYVDRVYDAAGRLLRQWRQRPEVVFRAETAYLLNHVLADESVRYTTAFNLDPSADTVMAVKTGTDDNYTNNHIVGYTKSVAFGAWMGNHDEAFQFEGSQSTSVPKALMLKPFMESYHENVPYEKRNHWTRPAGIKEVDIDLLTGYQAIGNSSSESEEERLSRIDIFPSWYVPQVSPEFDRVVDIDIASGKLAGPCTPPSAIRQLRAVKIKSEIEIDDPFYEIWQTPILAGLQEELQVAGYTGAVDDLHSCDDRRPQIRVISQSEACNDLCQVQVEVTAGTFDLKQVNFIHNFKTLTDGELVVEGRSQVLSYDYRPSSVDSPANVRGALSIEVVDEGFYVDRVDVFFQIAGFPSPVLPDDNIRLTSLNIDQSTQTAAVDWSRPAYGLELHFGGGCEIIAPILLNGESTRVEIGITDFPEGVCDAFIVDAEGRLSNRLSFQIGDDQYAF